MAKPIRVGILDDLADGPPSSMAKMEAWLRYAVDELIAAKRIDREVEFVNAYGLGLPTGTAGLRGRSAGVSTKSALACWTTTPA